MSLNKDAKVVRVTLRTRTVEDETITLPYPVVKQILETGQPEALWAFFGEVAKMPPYRKTIHDKEWLKLIVNYVPTTENKNGETIPKHVPESERACWYPLARRVHMLKEIDGGVMQFSRAQAKMIWERFTSPDFKLLPGQQFKEFMLEFADAIGEAMPGIQMDQDFDAEMEYPQEPGAAGNNGQRDEAVPQTAVAE